MKGSETLRGQPPQCRLHDASRLMPGARVWIASSNISSCVFQCSLLGAQHSAITRDWHHGFAFLSVSLSELSCGQSLPESRRVRLGTLTGTRQQACVTGASKTCQKDTRLEKTIDAFQEQHEEHISCRNTSFGWAHLQAPSHEGV